MTASRILLVVAGVLVVGLVLGLVFALHGERTPRPVAVAPEPPPVPNPNPNPPPSPNPNPPPSPTPRPNPPTMTPTPPEGEAEAPVVRDHRGEGPPPGAHHGLLPDTMVAARNALTPEMQACGSAVSQISDAGKIRFFVHTTYRVANGRITSTGVELDGADSLGAEYASCVRRVFGTLGVAAPAGQPDGEELVHLPFVGP